eukprot:3940624-Rhodomonas_salina.6
MSGTDIRDLQHRPEMCSYFWFSSRQVATSLRACYAMSGTEVAYGDVCVRACYAMSGTHLAENVLSEYGITTVMAVNMDMSGPQVSSYALPMLCPVLASRRRVLSYAHSRY